MRPVWNIELSAQGDALLGAFNQVARIMLKPTAQCSCLLESNLLQVLSISSSSV
jgi:hypothetical protein